MKRKRIRKRLIAACLGLGLGYLLAGMVSAQPSSSATQPAEHAATQPQASLNPSADGVKMLYPQSAQSAWVGAALGGVAALFVLAIGAGLANRALMIKDPAEQAAERHG